MFPVGTSSLFGRDVSKQKHVMGCPRSGILRHELQSSSIHQKWCQRGLPAHLCSIETHAVGPGVCSAARSRCQCTPASLFVGPTHIEHSNLRESKQIPGGYPGTTSCQNGVVVDYPSRLQFIIERSSHTGSVPQGRVFTQAAVSFTNETCRLALPPVTPFTSVID